MTLHRYLNLRMVIPPGNQAATLLSLADSQYSGTSCCASSIAGSNRQSQIFSLPPDLSSSSRGFDKAHDLLDEIARNLIDLSPL